MTRKIKTTVLSLLSRTFKRSVLACQIPFGCCSFSDRGAGGQVPKRIEASRQIHLCGRPGAAVIAAALTVNAARGYSRTGFPAGTLSGCVQRACGWRRHCRGGCNKERNRFPRTLTSGRKKLSTLQLGQIDRIIHNDKSCFHGAWHEEWLYNLQFMYSMRAVYWVCQYVIVGVHQTDDALTLLLFFGDGNTCNAQAYGWVYTYPNNYVAMTVLRSVASCCATSCDPRQTGFIFV